MEPYSTAGIRLTLSQGDGVGHRVGAAMGDAHEYSGYPGLFEHVAGLQEARTHARRGHK